MDNNKKSKYDRILSLYEKFKSGVIVRKAEEANRFGVSERTIQRDIDDIRAFFDNNSANIGLDKSVKYDRSQCGYFLHSKRDEHLNEGEGLAVCKILLDSRALIRTEMMPIIDKILNNCISSRFKHNVSELISCEKFNYCEPRHGKPVLDNLCLLRDAISRHRIIEAEYERLGRSTPVRRRLKPLGIMVQDFYFYLAAFIDDIDKEKHFDDPDDINPTIYRIDRIKSIKDTGENFTVPYRDRFNDGEFKKRIQFMRSGRLNTIRFEFSGPSAEAILDHIPTAVVKQEKDGVYIIEAETFGDGARMWLKTQEDKVKMLN